MYGGIKYSIEDESMIKKKSTNELWVYHFDTNKWFLLNSSPKEKYSRNYVLPISVSGHSMHLIYRPVFSTGFNSNQVNKSLVIFFGYSEYYGSTLSIIQEYNLGILMF